ncbi:hypothetical protein HK104_005103 [Borealophlyctis nickersoniae]|nr:hypothetical protein HK104_005103 [Borealophlyctis nickersoniae]
MAHAKMIMQSRSMAMPAVASKPHAMPWFDRQGQPSIFDLFDKAKAPAQIRRSFRFTSAASALPKNQSDLPPDDGRFLSVQVGEDAYFSRPDSLGVADGVGGWAQVKGANPALYSRKIMHYVSAELEKLDDISSIDYDASSYNDVDPKDILEKSYNQVTADAKEEGLVGSSTAVIVILRDDELRVANLGDCGVMVIRHDEPIFRTEEQQHSFNFPFQIGTGSRDSPSDAQSFRVKVQEGDIVIVGSDGMFDNIFDDEIVEIVTRVVGGSAVAGDPKAIAEALMRRAREVAEDTRFATSPFQSRAIQEGLYYQGGKMDDVTVLAGVVRLSEDSPDRR